jgi:hypothetical protein
MRSQLTLYVLCAVSALCLSCRDQRAAEERPALTDASLSDASLSDAPADTGEPEVTSTDAETAQDVVVDEDAAPRDPCAPPARVGPQVVHGSGGAVVTLEGAEFYIGALWWCLALEGEGGERRVISGELYALEQPNGACNLSFMLPPLPPGAYQVRASYGCHFSGDDPRTGDFGVLTIAPPSAPEPMAARCDEARPCALSYERCHPSLGVCVGDVCQGMPCVGDDGMPPAGLCALVTGCVPPERQCATDGDCRVVEVGCGCLGVHSADTRAYGGECYLGGCVGCDAAPCSDRYTPWCDGAGRCDLRPR